MLDQLEKYIASHKYAELELEADENIICRAITSRPALETAHLNFVRAKQCQQAAVITLTHRSTNIGLNLAALEALRSGSTIKIAKIDPLAAKILIRYSLESTWCDVWKKDDKNQHAKKFFPVPNDAILLKNINLSWEMMQILTGHINLKGFNSKIKKNDTQACSCMASEETVEHFILECPTFSEERTKLNRTILEYRLRTPVTLKLFVADRRLWRALENYVRSTKRL